MVIRNGALLALMTAASTYLGLPEGLFLVVGMLIVLESPLGGGLIDARERVLGSLMGLLSVVIALGALHAATQPLQIFIGLMLVRLFSFAIGLNSGFVVGGHMVAGSLPTAGSDWWHYAFWRFIMTVAGVLIGLYCSRTIYPRQVTNAWQRDCQSWFSGLAQALNNLALTPGEFSRFEDLREQRNVLRKNLPKLVAEQVYLNEPTNHLLIDPQLCLQHGSTVLSCTRDLASLLVTPGVESWALDLPIRELFQCGGECLQQLATGQRSSATASRLIEIRAKIEDDICHHLELAPHEPDSLDTFLLASRLLLLAGAFIDIAPPVATTTTSP